MVYEDSPGIFKIAVNVDGEWWIDESITKWMYDLKRNHMSALNSRKTYARALDIFLHYYIYNKQKKNQSLYDYLLEFREELRNGVHIQTYREISTERLKIQKLYTVLKTKAFAVSTINTYMTGIQWYLSYLKEQGKVAVDTLFSNETDWYQLKQRSIHGKGGGYGLMMGPLLAQLLGPKKKLIRNIGIDRQSNELNNYFPPELFLDLLAESSPREQAIYLLCGCAGARIGQALTLTRDDYNYSTNEVFLIDPLSDERGPSGIKGRYGLITEDYRINMEEKPYKELACKYPIPLQYAELLWIDASFKADFFKALSKVKKGNPIQNQHPFVFNTKYGKVLTPNESYNIFRVKIKHLKQKIRNEWLLKKEQISLRDRIEIDSEYKYLLEQLERVKGLHSLRHMYGIMWADHAAINPDLNIMELQLLCAYGLGHKNHSSVLAYFSLRQKSRNMLTQRLTNSLPSNHEYIQQNISLIKQYHMRKRA